MPGMPDWLRNLLSTPEGFAAGLAAAVALAAAATSVFVAFRQQRELRHQREVDFRQRQLDELYGPLMMWRAVSFRLRAMLPHQNESGGEWRLVDHITDVKSGVEPQWLHAVEEILVTTKHVETLLSTKAGLFEALPPPQSFTDALAHARLLDLSWRHGNNQAADSRLAFPRDFDSDIAAHVGVIRTRLERLGSGKLVSGSTARVTPKR